MQVHTMRIEVNETAKAFRVNGVTFAKRHLEKTISAGCNGDVQKMLAKFLVIVPYLATSFELSDKASDSVKYGAIKAKRLYKALEINEDNTVPFMLIFMQQAGMEPAEGVPALGREMRDAGFNNMASAASFQDGERDNVVSFPRKPTLH